MLLYSTSCGWTAEKNWYMIGRWCVFEIGAHTYLLYCSVISSLLNRRSRLYQRSHLLLLKECKKIAVKKQEHVIYFSPVQHHIAVILLLSPDMNVTVKVSNCDGLRNFSWFRKDWPIGIFIIFSEHPKIIS